MGLFGGAGVGKTVNMMELINNIAKGPLRVCRCSLVWASVPAKATTSTMKWPIPGGEPEKLEVQGCHGVWPDERPPGNRLRVALTGLTIAESFRDEGRDVLFFVDNIYRYTLAGTEVSALLGRMPSAVGYQPTLAENGSSAGVLRRPRSVRSLPSRPFTCQPMT